MRLVHSLPLAAAIALAACGGDADTVADGNLTAEEIAAASEGMIQPFPGQYQASLELLDFEAPELPAGDMEQMQQMFDSGLGEGNSFFITEEDTVQKGAE